MLSTKQEEDKHSAECCLNLSYDVLCWMLRGRTIEFCCSTVNVTIIDGIVDQNAGNETNMFTWGRCIYNIQYAKGINDISIYSIYIYQ